MADEYETKRTDDRDTKNEAHGVAQIRDAPEGVLEEGSLDPVYEAKARVLNKAILELGMGRYQWQVSRYSLHGFYIR
jgi:hypothetical protein